MKKLFVIFIVMVFYSTALLSQESGVFTDSRDGQQYKWVKIGNQIWMAENLRYNARGSCYKDLRLYGRLYDYYTALKSCPPGWHLPSDGEWLELEYFLGLKESIDEDYEYWEDDYAYYRQYVWVGAGNLKSKYGWKANHGKNGNGDDIFGFNALPGGYFQSYTGKFMLWGWDAHFWTSTSINNDFAIERHIEGTHDGIERIDMYKVHGCSVRCIKNR